MTNRTPRIAIALAAGLVFVALAPATVLADSAAPAKTAVAQKAVDQTTTGSVAAPDAWFTGNDCTAGEADCLEAAKSPYPTNALSGMNFY